jgi:hypothetical protein
METDSQGGMLTNQKDYTELATVWYDKFQALQARIDKIEKNALKRYGNKGVAAYMLKTSSDYWLYRDLVTDRDIAMRNAQLNASMAAIR